MTRDFAFSNQDNNNNDGDDDDDNMKLLFLRESSQHMQIKLLTLLVYLRHKQAETRHKLQSSITSINSS